MSVKISVFSSDQRVFPVISQFGPAYWVANNGLVLYAQHHDTDTGLARTAVAAAFAYSSIRSPLDPDNPPDAEFGDPLWTAERLDVLRHGLKLRMGWWRCSDLTAAGGKPIRPDLTLIDDEHDSDWDVFQDMMQPGSDLFNSFVASQAQCADALVTVRGWL